MHECMIMASSNLLSLALFLVLLTHANSARDTSFDFPSFRREDTKRLILQGDANVASNGVLRLTNDTSNSMGRAFYFTPIQIRDRTTSNLASFDTKFTFNSAYDLAFALVPVGSKLKRNYAHGLFPPYFNPDVHTVAVVFNTVSNRIEIDVNSAWPVATTTCNFVKNNGEEAEVLITYDSSKNNLRASLVYPSGNKCDVSATVQLEYVVDDWVGVGFSATSGLNGKTTETNNLLSWSFSSEFPHHTTSERSKILLNNIL